MLRFTFCCMLLWGVMWNKGSGQAIVYTDKLPYYLTDVYQRLKQNEPYSGMSFLYNAAALCLLRTPIFIAGVKNRYELPDYAQVDFNAALPLSFAALSCGVSSLQTPQMKTYQYDAKVGKKITDMWFAGVQFSYYEMVFPSIKTNKSTYFFEWHNLITIRPQWILSFSFKNPTNNTFNSSVSSERIEKIITLGMGYTFQNTTFVIELIKTEGVPLSLNSTLWVQLTQAFKAGLGYLSYNTKPYLVLCYRIVPKVHATTFIEHHPYLGLSSGFWLSFSLPKR